MHLPWIAFGCELLIKVVVASGLHVDAELICGLCAFVIHIWSGPQVEVGVCFAGVSCPSPCARASSEF